MWNLQLKGRAVAHKQSKGTTKWLRDYKFQRLHIVPM